MKFLLDANIRAVVGKRLQSCGHEVRFLAGTEDHALADRDVLNLAFQEDCILITNDKDFGQLIFQHQLPHAGVVLFRLSDESRVSVQARLDAVVKLYSDRLHGHFLVVTDEHVRYR